MGWVVGSQSNVEKWFLGRGRRRQVKDFKQAVKPETASRDTGGGGGGGQIINWGG